MRYKCLKKLLESISKYYSSVAVIIADDTPPELYEQISIKEFPNVKQFKIPAESGFFAGRALAISQVLTEYFITVDDDFIMTENTRLEDLLEIIDESGYDQGCKFRQKILSESEAKAKSPEKSRAKAKRKRRV